MEEYLILSRLYVAYSSLVKKESDYLSARVRIFCKIIVRRYQIPEHSFDPEQLSVSTRLQKATRTSAFETPQLPEHVPNVETFCRVSIS